MSRASESMVEGSPAVLTLEKGTAYGLYHDKNNGRTG